MAVHYQRPFKSEIISSGLEKNSDPRSNALNSTPMERVTQC